MEKPWILIISAGSDIAMKTAERFVALGNNLYLAAHHPEEIQSFADNLTLRYHVKITVLPFDIVKTQSHDAFLSSLPVVPKGILIATGYAGEQEYSENNMKEVEHIINVNFIGCIFFLEICVKYFEGKKAFIVAISSVAGERGRRSNYIYGASKAGLTAYLSGLRVRLRPKGIEVITIIPGIVRTKMSAGKVFPQFLAATPEKVAIDIEKAIRQRTPVIYTPWWWRFVMFSIKLIPERIFMRINW